MPSSSCLLQCFLTIVLFFILFQNTVAQTSWILSHDELEDSIQMAESVEINYNITVRENSQISGDYYLNIYSEDSHVAVVDEEVLLQNASYEGFYTGYFTITGNFLGQTKITFRISDGSGETVFQDSMDVTVTRQSGVIDTVFTVSVAVLVVMLYINFGCALHWDELKTNLKRPIGPAIGLVTQFGAMPVVSYFLGKLLFPDNLEMRLGFFFTGCSPPGGSSNIYAVLLDGNLDLSITMTSVSTLASFGTMPLWLFTLGRVIFENGDLTVPYSEITTSAAALIIPLIIGFLIKRYMKKVGDFLTKIVKISSVILLVFIGIFILTINFYLLELFSWQIVVAALGLPCCGYITGYLVAFLFRLPPSDCLVVAIETGIQNTNIAVFLLRFCLGQPQADITTVAPMSVAIMQPVPLICMIIYKQGKSRFTRRDHKFCGDTEHLEAGEEELKPK